MDNEDNIEQEFEKLKQKYFKGLSIIKCKDQDRDIKKTRDFVRERFRSMSIEECNNDIKFLYSIINHPENRSEKTVKEAEVLEKSLSYELMTIVNSGVEYVPKITKPKKVSDRRKKYMHKYLDIELLCDLSKPYFNTEHKKTIDKLSKELYSYAKKANFSKIDTLTQKIINFVNHNLPNIPSSQQDTEDQIVEIILRYEK